MSFLVDICNDASFILRIGVKLLKVLRFVIPIILTVLIVFDLAKAITGEVDDKAKKDAISRISKRFIYAVIIFLIPTVINLVLRNITPSETYDNSWYSCWLKYYNE